MVRPAMVLTALFTAAAFAAGIGTTPVVAERPSAPGENPWQYDHWPQRQPWQETGPGARHLGGDGFPDPVDPQNWENPDHMTWDDYRKPPGTTWNDPARKGSSRTFKGALVLADYTNQPFVVTRPANSTVFGNPSTQAHDIPRDQVARFYQDFLNKPNDLNRGHTLHEYWMEDSGGRYGVELTAFGPYKMPGKAHEYGMEFQGTGSCPSGDSCSKSLPTDAKKAWTADVGTGVPAGFDFVFYLSSGQDESSTWQEFGQMKFPTKSDVTDAFGPPDPKLPNSAPTRYVDWTSWAAGASIWPSASGGSSTQAESSGMGVFAHEFSHILGIGDNYNNPYGKPARRSYSGIWEMLSRGSFNGPGGPHSRWLIPATAGASMGAQHMLRNKIKLKMVDERNVLRLSRDGLTDTVTAKVTARSVQPGATGLSGVNIEFGTKGDLSPRCSTSTDPLCDGGGYQNYTVEVVDRMGTDSFTPDSGVLLAKTKNQDSAPFEWVIDANPKDIGMTDYVLPDGTKVPITIGDYRQLSDALFHAGPDSGSQNEYVDKANRLHFYIVERHVNDKGELSYTVAIRPTGTAPTRTHGVALTPATAQSTRDGLTTCSFALRNTGAPASAGQHPDDVSQYLGDVYRLSVEGTGAATRLPNTLVTAKPGEQVQVPVYARPDAGTAPATVRVTATSESDPGKRATTTCVLR